MSRLRLILGLLCKDLNFQQCLVYRPDCIFSYPRSALLMDPFVSKNLAWISQTPPRSRAPTVNLSSDTPSNLRSNASLLKYEGIINIMQSHPILGAAYLCLDFKNSEIPYYIIPNLQTVIQYYIHREYPDNLNPYSNLRIDNLLTMEIASTSHTVLFLASFRFPHNSTLGESLTKVWVWFHLW